ncbi:hypothetical protein [Candidatus Paracaedibacter symbiosus]|uniref:hypothetical protein n=1 Tax=Candidatus Paracaedibacter symbiosus TaxID=244582 RepID=UPI0018DC36F0|nr:hypothetical protein [Candidatus Paracaedibacter symbiosus]
MKKGEKKVKLTVDMSREKYVLNGIWTQRRRRRTRRNGSEVEGKVVGEEFKEIFKK